MTMLTHISIYTHSFAVANPFKSFRQIILSFHIPLDIMTPFLNFRILRIAEYSFGSIHELA